MCVYNKLPTSRPPQNAPAHIHFHTQTCTYRGAFSFHDFMRHISKKVGINTYTCT